VTGSSVRSVSCTLEHTRERSPERVVGWAFGEKSFRERERWAGFTKVLNQNF
jgi:hypothetical protein